MAGRSSMSTVVTGGGTLDRKSSRVGGGCALDNVDNPASCGGERAIEELDEDEWSARRYLSVMKWSNTAIHPRPNDAVGCKNAHDQDENVKRDVRSHEHGKLNAPLYTRRKDMLLHTFQHSKTAPEVAKFTGSGCPWT